MLTNHMTIGERFKKIRTDRGMSQPFLAEGICSPTMISLLENGKKIPSARIMGKLADKLGIPLREMMNKDEQQLEIDLQIEMLRVYMETGDYEHALNLATELTNREDIVQHQAVELLFLRTDALNKSKRYGESIELLLPFLQEQQVQQSVDDEMLCHTYNKLGTAFFQLRDFEKAFSAYEQGYRLSLKLAEFGLVSARVTFNLGLVCNQLSIKDEATFYLEKAKRFFESVSDVKSMAKTFFELAIATVNPEYMTRARVLFESLNLVREANIVKQHYTFHIESKTDYKKAVRELMEIASEFIGIGDPGMSIYTFTRAAMISIQHGNMEIANTCMRSAIEHEEKLQNKTPFVLSYLYRVKSELNFHLGNFDDCISDSLKSTYMYDKMGMYDDSADALEVCAKVHQLRGDYVKSHEVLTEVVQLLRKGKRGINK